MIICVVGEKNSGKTEVACQLVQALQKRGFTVAALKHSISEPKFEPPATDTARLKAAGASPVAFLSHSNCFISLPPKDPKDLLQALSVLADFVVVEGLRESDHPKIAVGNEKGLKNVVLQVEGPCREVEELAQKLQPQRPTTAAFTRSKSVHLNPFVRGMLQALLTAFFSQLRGVEGDEIVVLTRTTESEGQNDT